MRPKPGAKRNPTRAAESASRSARVVTWADVSAWAWVSTWAWVKWTTYKGAWSLPSSDSIVALRGVRRYSKTSGTGRTAERTTATGRPVRRASPFSMALVSPRVADMRTNCARVSSRRGTCQAQPRSGSP